MFDAELAFWVIGGILSLLFLLALPFINNYIKNKEVEEMFAWQDRDDSDQEGYGWN